jgi:hypothetical protein
MCVKIIKANIAVTIALGLLFVDSIRSVTGTGVILASVAVEFVHPAKSYGFIFEVYSPFFFLKKKKSNDVI